MKIAAKILLVLACVTTSQDALTAGNLANIKLTFAICCGLVAAFLE